MAEFRPWQPRGKRRSLTNLVGTRPAVGSIAPLGKDHRCRVSMMSRIS
jgi:hypothetical protein